MTDMYQARVGPKRARTMDRILDAAAELFAERGAGQVSVRDVAERAGVSHALVHRYFGNKDDLVRAAFERSAEQVQAAVGSAETASEFLDGILRLFLEEPLIARMMLRSLLEGWQMGPDDSHFPVVGRALQLMDAEKELPAPGDEPFSTGLVVAASAAILLGWTASEERLVTSAGIADEDREELRSELRRLIRRVLAMSRGGTRR